MAVFHSNANLDASEPSSGRLGSAVASAVGAALGATFYLIVVRLVLVQMVGEKYWIGRVMSHWINMFTFIAFGTAIAILIWRVWRIRGEKKAFYLGLLQGDVNTLLLAQDAGELRKQMHMIPNKYRQLILVRLLSAGLQRSRANWSSEDVGEAIKNQAELIQGQIESQYALVRYLAWAIPSIGFVGTVLGIGEALGSMNPATAQSDSTSRLSQAVGYLHTAFDTTLVALVLSLVLMYVLHTVQAEEDSLVVRATDWCMHRFVFRMHTS